MLQVVLLLEHLVESLHARGEGLSRVVVQVRKVYPIRVRWRFHLKNVEVNSVVVR